MKLNVNSILKLCIGASALVLSIAVFNFSVRPAHAAPPAPAEFIEEGISKIGKYQMTLSGVSSGEKTVWTCIVYNTETGQARTYSETGSMTFGPHFNISTTSPAGD